MNRCLLAFVFGQVPAYGAIDEMRRSVVSTMWGETAKNTCNGCVFWLGRLQAASSIESTPRPDEKTQHVMLSMTDGIGRNG